MSEVKMKLSPRLSAVCVALVALMLSTAGLADAGDQKHPKTTMKAPATKKTTEPSGRKGSAQLDTNLLQAQSNTEQSIAKNMKAPATKKTTKPSGRKGSAQLDTNLLQEEASTTQAITKNMKP
jgi:hypothetical protein